MKKKNSARDNLNLFFSSFLIIAYIICGYFFVSFTESLNNSYVKSTVLVLILVVFGLLVFYATRVGEGKPVVRFSLVTLIVLDLPTLYILLAAIIPAFPLHDILAINAVMIYMAGAALGYGIPYTFLSGFENVPEEAEEDFEEAEQPLEGGLQRELEEAQTATELSYEPETEEIVVEGTAIIEDIDAYNAEKEAEE